jgi:hypothetical protein
MPMDTSDSTVSGVVLEENCQRMFLNTSWAASFDDIDGVWFGYFRIFD